MLREDFYASTGPDFAASPPPLRRHRWGHWPPRHRLAAGLVGV